MKRDSRLDQKSFRVLTGQDSKTAPKTIASHRRIAMIASEAERLADGCVIYRLERVPEPMAV